MSTCINNKSYYSAQALGITCQSRPPIDAFKRAFNPSCNKGVCQKDVEEFSLFYQQMLYLMDASPGEQQKDAPAIKYVAEFLHELCPTSQAFQSVSIHGQSFVHSLPRLFPVTFMHLAIEMSGCDKTAFNDIMPSS